MIQIKRLCQLLLILLCTPPVLAENISIHLKWYHKFQFAGYYAAEQQGYFKDEGYNVKLIEGGPNKSHLHSLLNNQSEYAVLGGEALNALAVDSPIVIIASIFQQAPEALFTLKSNNVKHITELKGKTLMLAPPNISGNIEAMLLDNGLMAGDYTKLDYDGDVSHLINGDVFAIYGYISNEPYQLKQLGYEVDIFRPLDFRINFYGDSLVTSQSELEDHPKRVAAIRRAVIRGWHYALKHPEEIINHILVRATNNPAPFNREHQQNEARETIDIIAADLFPIGHSSPDRWAAMFDIYNEVNNAQATFKGSSIYHELHQDHNWIQYFLILAALALVLITVLYVCNRTLRTRLNSAIQGLEKAVFEDNLTGMKNRSALILFIEECRLKQRNDEYLAILDISSLQKINKEKGFRKADQIIMNVAASLVKHKIKTSKSYSLYAGKFAIISKADKYQTFEKKINYLIDKIIKENDSISLRSGAVKLDLSLDNSSLTTRAELALRHAKDTSAHKLICFDKSFSERIEKREQLLADVVTGISKKEFIPYYQPKLNYETGKIQGVEALIRWNHPDKGILLPGKFLPIVESAPEVMNQLETDILDSIMAEAGTLIEHFAENPDFRISINLSSIQFNHESLVLDLLVACKRYNISPSHIELELTESLMLEDLDTAIRISNQLQAAEFRVALDDFGTGYSSLSYIQNLPVNVIKLDYSFVRKIPKDKRSGFVVEHIISLAHKLELEIVAEGVEEKDQLDYLGDLAVDIIQGFYFFRPMPLTEICKLETSISNYK